MLVSNAPSNYFRTVGEKLRIVECAEARHAQHESYRSIAADLGVDRKVLRKWMDAKPQLLMMQRNRQLSHRSLHKAALVPLTTSRTNLFLGFKKDAAMAMPCPTLSSSLQRANLM